MSKPFKVIISLVLVLVQAGLVGVLPYLMYGWFLTTPDAGGWSCGAQTLADTGQFSTGHTGDLGYNFNICWTSSTYPGLQYFLAGIIKLTHVPGYHLVPVVLVLTLMTLAGVLWAIGWVTSRSLLVATITGLSTSLVPIVLRAEILTPQNLIGYCLISILVLSLALIVTTKNWWLWFLVIPVTGLLGYIHSLSFGVAGVTCAVWFYLWYLPNWKWKLVIGILGLVGFGLVWQFEILPVSLHEAVNLFKSGAYSGYDHPLYDHPAFLGYGLAALAVIGLLFYKDKRSAVYGLMISWLVVPLIMGHLSVIGWILLPDRFVAYCWLGVVLLAAVGIEQLRTMIKWPAWLWLGCVLLIWSAQLAHTVVYIKDDITGWSNRFKPQAEFITAVQWLNTNQPNDGVLVGIMAAANREITFAPLWYDGPIASYPWYNLNHRNLKSFKANSSLYKTVFTDQTSAEYLRVQAFYNIIAKPNSPEAYPAAQQYHLSYLIMPKGSQADIIWQTAQPASFPQIYENQTYRIYSLR